MNKIKFLSNIVKYSDYRRNYSKSIGNTIHVLNRKCISNPISENDPILRRLNTSSEEIYNEKKEKTFKQKDDLRDRSVVITPEESIRYMQSTGFRQTYAHYKVWHLFRRNFPGQYSPLRSRHTCVVDKWIYTSNPCPICRDKYLVLHYSNVHLLNHFINPHSGYVYENTVLGLCAVQYEKLLVSVTLAKDYGLLSFEVPVRTYDYRDYYTHDKCHHLLNHKNTN